MAAARRRDVLTRRWERFWFARVPPHVYALYRAAVGLVGCLTMAGLADVPMLLAIDGLAPAPGGGLGVREALHTAGLGLTTAWLLFAGNLLAFVCLIAGLWTTVASLAAFVGTAALIWWNPLPLSAAQHLLHILTFYLLFVDAGAVWSVDAARRGRQTPHGQPIWPLRLLRYQVCVMYASAAVWKVFDPSWRDGSALHYALNYDAVQRWPWEVPAMLAPLLVGLSWLTLAWEGLFAPAMLNRRTRRIALWMGVALHLGMWSVLELGPFTFTVLAAYVAFLEPEHVPALGQRLVSAGNSISRRLAQRRARGLSRSRSSTSQPLS